MRLFDLAHQYKSLEALEASEELPEEVIRDTLDGLLGDFESKAVAVAQFILSLEAHAQDVFEAADAMTKRAKRMEKRADSIRSYLLLQMQIIDQKRIETPEIIVSRRLNPPAVQITDEATVPAQFWVQPPAPPPRIDRKLIREALQSGTDVPGCYIESGERVDIRL